MKFNNRNILISPNAKIGNNVKIGDNTIIYDNVSIGNNTVICNDCVIGEPLFDYYSNDNYINPVTEINQGAFIRSHNIIYAGSVFGEKFSTGHRVTIREFVKFGSNCRIGTLSDIQGYSSFGNYCWLHSNVHIGQKSIIGNFVFIYPYVIFTNDPTPPSDVCVGPSVGDFSQIAVSSILLPGIEIGKHCLVGANSVVSRNVDDYMLVVGSPAQPIKDVREILSRETGQPHYPWPFRFTRGMPWAERGFEEWKDYNEL